ncbi:MAG: choice-of-anchor J domain-containing protein [Duncaniella sp.]|nr:choice-of-anchor J domain-containing protein [Duncaniella sp.]
MKNILKYTGLLALGFVSLTSCQDDVDAPVSTAPVATITANTTIAEVKERFWSDDRNYIWSNPETDEVISSIPLTESGEHMIISGRVVSSDASGNIYKSLVIQDETGALAMSINANSMYNQYRRGQEILVDLTDMWIGKYNGLQQLGFPNFTEQYGWEATFMPFEFFKEHIQLNGMPEPDAIDVITITGADLQSSTPENLRRLQSQFVRINDCEFEGGGTLTFTEGSKTTTNRNLKLADGTTLIVRTSGYSNFWGHTLPAGRGDVMGILSYYGTDWQLLLNSDRDCINFGIPTQNPGSEDVPYTVDQAIEIINAGSAANDVWTTGFIVGAVAPGVTEVASNADVEFTASVSMDNTLVIAAAPDVKDYTECLVMSLPQGSLLRTYGNLLDHPENYGKAITLKGNLVKVMTTTGITTTGAAGTFAIEGVDLPGGSVTGTIFSEPFDIGMGQFTVETVTSPGFDVWKHDSKYKYMIATAYVSDSKENKAADSWLISPVISLKGAPAAFLSFEQAINFFSSVDKAKEEATVAVREAGSATWTTLTIPNYPSSMSWDLVASGDIDLSAFVGKDVQIGFHYTSTASKAGTWELKNVVVKTEGTPSTPSTPGDDDPVTPPSGDAIDATSADFGTLNGGKAIATYGTYSSADGWTATNAQVLSGGAADGKTEFTFISSDPSVMAVCLNGKKGSCGVLTSPLIANNLGSLSFNYGLPYSKDKISLLIEVLDAAGQVVRSTTLENLSPDQKQVYTFDGDFDVEGTFMLRITNQGPSQYEGGNKDRVAIWNITWTR